MEKDEAYKWAKKRIRAQVLRHLDIVATLANTSAILKHYLPNFFWVGFYFVRPDHLLLGPFQGPPACVKLKRDRGVCATCAEQNKTIVVPDVHKFPGHVACDDRSNSEIAVPIFDRTGKIRAILDADSESLNDFSELDQKNLDTIASLLKDIWMG
jgi:L-methionine (R)-S-oxide reductase